MGFRFGTGGQSPTFDVGTVGVSSSVSLRFHGGAASKLLLLRLTRLLPSLRRPGHVGPRLPHMGLVRRAGDLWIRAASDAHAPVLTHKLQDMYEAEWVETICVDTSSLTAPRAVKSTHFMWIKSSEHVLV